METEQSAFQQQPTAAGRTDRPVMHNDGVIYIGKKGVMSYVWAVVTQFNNGSAEVKIKARGRSISKAVDVTQIVKNRFIQNSLIKDIALSTEELQSEDGSMSKVSSIEVRMSLSGPMVKVERQPRVSSDGQSVEQPADQAPAGFATDADA
jgi:DNA-binding protein